MANQSISWDQLTHSPSEACGQPSEILARYREFQSVVKGLSRQELITRGWLKCDEDKGSLSALFFSLPNDLGSALFRKSDASNNALIAFWLARARRESECLCLAERYPEFTMIDKAYLRNLVRLSVDPTQIAKLPKILMKKGIILVYIQSLPGMKADGAYFKLGTGQPVIALSLRYPRLDYFWFTLLHELAHIVLHSDDIAEPVFFDVDEEKEVEPLERAANRVAKDSIVDRNSWRSCPPKFDPRPETVEMFAASEGVHASLIAGLLRKETGDFRMYSQIVNKYDAREIIFRK